MSGEINLLLVAVVSGIGIGSVYVLLALSYNLVLGSSGVFNLAQGTVVMAGTLGAYLVEVRYGWPIWTAVPILAAFGFAAGRLTELLGVRPVAGRSVSVAEAAIVTTLGLGLIGDSTAGLTFGSDPQPVPSYTSTTPLLVGGVPIRPVFVVMVAVTLLIALGFDRVARRTQVGHMLRATLEDREAAELLGIDTRRVTRVVFGLAGTLSALAGFLLAPITLASPFVANDLGLYGFAAMAVGGFGSFTGSLVGGVLVGIVGSLVPAVASAHLARPAIFVMVIAILLIRPGGLFGTAGLFGSRKLREV
jgi:branched-chain amino acid transport system permease protein